VEQDGEQTSQNALGWSSGSLENIEGGTWSLLPTRFGNEDVINCFEKAMKIGIKNTQCLKMLLVKNGAGIYGKHQKT
jgi:hypothetical protein